SDGHDEVDRLSVGILERERDRNVENVARLLEMEHEFLSGRRGLDPVCELQARQRRAVDPALEEALERTVGFRFHRVPKIFGTRLSETRLRVKPAKSAEERIVADEASQHVQDGRALVVNEGAEHPAFIANVSEPVSEVDRPLVRLVETPFPHLTHDGGERAI